VAEAGDYGSESIQVLEGLEAVRKRPGMYIGGTGERGLHHLVYEVVDNSVDEAMAGHCSRIDVELLDDGSVRVSDDGRGIPREEHSEYEVPAVEVVMTRLHAGGKFDHKSYQVSGGLHGVGVSVVNALSEWLEVEVKRDGKHYTQRFERGVPKKPSIEEGAEETGTEIRFKPDPEIFDTTDLKFETLVERMRELAFLNDGLEIVIGDGESRRSFQYEGGIASFVEHLNENRDPMSNVVHLEGEEGEIVVEAAMQWTSEYVSSIFAFANNINTKEGGTHLSGFKGGLTRAVNEYAKKEERLDERLRGEDVREGMTVVLSVMIPDPQFEGQTKTKLGNSEVRGVVESIIFDGISTYLEQNPKEASRVVDKAVQAMKARKAASEAKKLTRRKNALKSTRLPGKLSDCSSRKREGTELFIVEGDSAGGSAKQARDREFQAILPLKGKILNVEKARLDKILDNKEIRSLITALGTGVGDEFDLDDCRYSKVIIMTDADEDGAHIETLLLTFFYRYMKPMIEQGRVYLAKPPLYRIKKRSKEHYVYTEAEKEELLDDLGRRGTSLQRYKGLGEMSPKQLWETTMDPDSRVLLQVENPDDVEADELFTTLMGSHVEPRREFIKQHATEVENLDI